MNYAAVKEALSQCERYERYIRTLGDLDKRSAKIIQENGTSATYILMKTLMGVTAWDGQEFAMYLMPPDILAEAIHKASERVENTVAQSMDQARKLIEEGFAVDNIGKKKSKSVTTE